MQPTNQFCKNCGAPLTGTYCSKCGEKIYTPKDKSVSHILGEGFHFITHLEGNYFRTLRSILTRPGRFSLDYCDGIRKKYFKPVSFFLIGVIIYLFIPYSRGLDMSFENNLGTLRFLSLTKTAAEKKAAAKHISMSELGHLYDTKSTKIAKILLLVILPLTGAALNLLFSKRKKKYFDHFILGTEISSFFLYFCFILLPVFWLVISSIFWLFGAQPGFLENEWAILPIYIAAMMAAYTKAFKLFYDIPYGHAFLKSFLFLIFHSIIILILYRLILYFVVLLFI